MVWISGPRRPQMKNGNPPLLPTSQKIETIFDFNLIKVHNSFPSPRRHHHPLLPQDTRNKSVRTMMLLNWPFWDNSEFGALREVEGTTYSQWSLIHNGYPQEVSVMATSIQHIWKHISKRKQNGNCFHLIRISIFKKFSNQLETVSILEIISKPNGNLGFHFGKFLGVSKMDLWRSFQEKHVVEGVLWMFLINPTHFRLFFESFPTLFQVISNHFGS